MTQKDIVTLTLNPALDLSSVVEQIHAGSKLRCSTPKRDPGGGGINVSRTIRFLGGNSLCVVAFGGATGNIVHDLMKAEGLQICPIFISGETRQGFAVMDQSKNEQYRFVAPGPNWTFAEKNQLMAACHSVAAPEMLAVFSGSLPPGISPDLPSEICATFGSKQASLIIDTSGAALMRIANQNCAFRPKVLRFDHQEAVELSSKPLASINETADFAARLVQNGTAENVVIACGADGNVLANNQARYLCIPTPVPVRSKIGAGDSFVGAFCLKLAQGDTMIAALLHGTAAANAAVMTEATELCRAEDVLRLEPKCQVQEI